jgi:hypothetical protein
MGEPEETSLSRQLMPTNEDIEAAFNRVSQWDYQCVIHRGEFASELFLDERCEDADVQGTGRMARVVPPIDEDGVTNR